MKKLEGLFGLKLGEVFDETKFEVTKKEFLHGDYHIEVEEPPKPNLLFKDYAVRCSKDMVIEDISANTLSHCFISLLIFHLNIPRGWW